MRGFFLRFWGCKSFGPYVFIPLTRKRAFSSVVERFVYTEDVGSSTLSTPTILPPFTENDPLAKGQDDPAICCYCPFMKFILLICVLFAFPVFAQEQAPPQARAFTGMTHPDKKKAEAQPARQPNVEIWLPPEFQSSEEKWPLLIFSHGFGGCAKQSAFLMKYLAENGYIVIAPDHEDANCARNNSKFGRRLQEMREGRAAKPEKPFRFPEDWDETTESDRRDDVLFALSSMLDDRQYKNYVDTNRMGLIGHSLGGYTVLGMAGAWKSWRDPRFKAVLALSPYVDPYLRKGRLSSIGIPVMYQGGTRDQPITPAIRASGGAYAQTRAPKYFIELKDADHFSWTELDPDYQAVIDETALAFFDRYVKGSSAPAVARKAGGQVSTVWKDEGL